ncbi:hypothetical protein FOCC_FOCC000068 [Frankliniella occidentalis]|nr:hypothetical protein FOCC_FOCC000068 [Frankliniella occidentalis]
MNNNNVPEAAEAKRWTLQNTKLPPQWQRSLPEKPVGPITIDDWNKFAWDSSKVGLAEETTVRHHVNVSSFPSSWGIVHIVVPPSVTSTCRYEPARFSQGKLS